MTDKDARRNPLIRVLRAMVLAAVLGATLVGATASFGAKPPPATPPRLDALSAPYGAPGTTLVLTGTGFGDKRTGSTVEFGGVGAGTYRSWSDTSISVVVPVGAARGDVVVIVDKARSNGLPFIPWGKPTIAGLNPAGAPAGATMIITGTGFGASASGSNVTVSGVSAAVSTWSDSSITVTVPDAASGAVVVDRGGVASDGFPFTRYYAPSITHVSASTGVVGSTVSIEGTEFGSIQGLGSVSFAGMPAVVTSWSDAIVTAIVPDAPAGDIVVSQYGLSSNGVAFAPFRPPRIDALSAMTGAVGSEVTITGVDFSDVEGAGTVSFTGLDAEVVSWSDTSIVVLVPDAAAGPVVVTQNGEPSNGVDFAPYRLPVIASLNPSLGQVGATVTITGADFGAMQGAGSVTFNGTSAEVISWSDSSIEVKVPAGASSGDAVVHVAVGDSNGASFKVFIAPRVTGITAVNAPDPLSDRENFVITGTGFEAVQGSGWVTWAGQRCPVVSWGDTEIVATVPDGAAAGYVGVWQNGVCSNGLWRQFNPAIDTMSNTVAVVGNTLVLTGRDFGAVQTPRAKVAISGVTCDIVSWSDTRIEFRVPAISQAGYVGVYRDGIGSNGKYLIPAPRLTSLSAKTLAPGQQLTIYGQAFGATQGTGCVVKIGGVEVPVVSWTDTSVVVIVTEQARTGYVGVYRAWASSNGLWFLPAYPPRIASVSATSAVPGDAITVTGEWFYAQSAGSKLTINGTSCPIVSWSPTQIVATVPSGATSGYVGVWNYGLCSNGVSIVIGP